MTIKLSTTISVNKTLQHKALWDLETSYRDVGGTVVAAVKEGVSLLRRRSRLWTPDILFL